MQLKIEKKKINNEVISRNFKKILQKFYFQRQTVYVSFPF